MSLCLQEGNGLSRGHLAEVKTHCCFKPSFTFISLPFPNFMSVQVQVSAGCTWVQGHVVSHPPKVLEWQQDQPGTPGSCMLGFSPPFSLCVPSPFPSFPFPLPLSQPAMASSSARGPGPCLHLEQEKPSRRENQHGQQKQFGIAMYWKLTSILTTI